MALQTYSRFAPEEATTNVAFSDVADGIVVEGDCTSVTLTLEDTTTVDLGDLPRRACVALRCTKVVFSGGAIKAFFISA